MSSVLPEIPNEEIKIICEAVAFFEQPSLLMKIAEVVGKPAEMLLKAAPQQVSEFANKALTSCMDWAAGSVPATDGHDSVVTAFESSGWSGFYSQIAAGFSGAVGGLFGLPGLAVELPFTTGIMLRSIAAIAAEFGNDLGDPSVRLECLSVFSYGGPSPDDDAMESSFFTTRAGMAVLIREAAKFVAGKAPAVIAAAVADGSAAFLVRLMARIATQFEVAVTEKFVAQSLPVIGAAGGASINAAFAGYFNSAARYHFAIGRLERQFGKDFVAAHYRAELAILKKHAIPLKAAPDGELPVSDGVLLRDPE